MKVKILDKKFVPGVGQGPFNEYIEVPRHIVRQLDQLGYRIVEEPKTLAYTADAKAVLAEIKKPVEEVVEPVIEEVVAEVAEEPVVEEVVEAVPYTLEELQELTNADLKEIILDAGLEVPTKDTKQNLIDVILGA